MRRHRFKEVVSGEKSNVINSNSYDGLFHTHSLLQPPQQAHEVDNRLDEEPSSLSS